MINLPQILFYCFAGLGIGSALMVISAKNTVRGVLFLVLTFFSAAGIWLLIESEFLALILVLVYVGAVMTLFLFVVMMLNLQQESLREKLTRAWPIGAVMVGSIVVLVILATYHMHFFNPTNSMRSADYSNVTDLGSVLYTTYVWPFEIAAVLLLTGIVAAIALAYHPADSLSMRSQKISKQLSVRRKDRIRLIKMKSEKK